MHQEIPPVARSFVRLFATDEEQSAWLGLVRTHASLERALDRRLLAEHGMALSSFETMTEIAHSEQGELGVSELAERVRLSPSRVSRLLIELEREGLVSRRKGESDSRSTRVAVTDAGFARLREVGATYLSTIRSAFLDRLSGDDVAALARIWETLADGV